MPIPQKTQAQLVSDFVASWSSQVGVSPVLYSGDPLLAIANANAAQATWIQALCSAVLAFARAGTATGADLDSWMADFGLVRLPATLAQGPVTLSVGAARLVAINIPSGTVIQNVGGSITYQLIADANQPTWNAALGAYVLSAGSLSLTATAQAILSGSASNVQPSLLVQFASPVGVDAVTNTAGITNGLDPETDVAFRARFIQYLNGLSKATSNAILFAINSVQQGLNSVLLENTTPAGVTQNGYFTAVVDDGSGAPPASLLTSITTAVNAVRAFSIQFSVIAPTKVTATIACNIRVATGAVVATVQTTVQTAIVNYVNALQIGQTLYLTDVIAAAINASTSVVAVQVGSMTINGAQLDLVPATGSTVLRTTTVSVSVGTF